jgi:hypothetical protein
VQQIRELNSATSHVDAAIVHLRVEDEPVLAGPALVEKANLQSQMQSEQTNSSHVQCARLSRV